MMKTISNLFRLATVMLVSFMLVNCSTTPPPAQDDDVVVEKVPVLGDIPLIGRLFRNEVRKPRSNTASSTDSSNAVPKQVVKRAPTEQTRSTPDRLKKLKELKDSGAITEEEYETQRKVLVEQL